jgi:hypothetical protein
MSEQANHHFVPKFYFRNFSEDGARIHLLHRSSGRVILNAAIRGQCAKHRLYGPTEMERMISGLEGNFSAAIREAIRTAWAPMDLRLTEECVFRLLQATLFQRGRTIHEIDKYEAGMESWLLEAFKQHLLNSPGIEYRDRMVKDIENGSITLRHDDTWVAMTLMIAALDAVILITDLRICLVRNHTDFPFLFGDAPVVLCNSHYRNVTLRGVLGLQTPGLQIFFPLNARTMLLMLDENVYSGRCKETDIVDVTDRSDVSQLNALQLHHSLTNVYFGREGDAEYVGDLWNAHKSSIVQSRNVFRVEKGWLVDGKPEDLLLHGFEPHLNFRLDLSFVKCNPIHPAEHQPSRRTPELAEEYNRITKIRNEQIENERRLKKNGGPS